MPELPEVETIVRKIKPQIVGRQILAADLRWARTLAAPSPRKFAEQVVGQKILNVGRRAKFIDIQLAEFHLLIHLRMSGYLHIKRGTNRPEKHDRLIIQLSGGRLLAFNDTRKFGRVWLVSDPKEIFKKLGPEPLGKEFTPQWLHAALRKKHRRLKPLLLDQTFLAGLGNIYTDEALNLAKLHPLRESSAVSARQAKALHDAIRKVLNEGIRRNGASIDWAYPGGEFQNYFRVYDCAGEPCQNCGAKIKRIVVGQRGTHYCPRCQRL
ncbi:MAG: bifunctional DNA-formamidopyrimidine glycosylase/DNA-(apurinic or apyrimidinic site) lyase [Anaerolineales bacterium]|nr:bifunctional DNA-formamidopyrimidine glycosylase/DNA-(apurinic or apyrimidinic site) lyase [Anaerolineales bacterium]